MAAASAIALETGKKLNEAVDYLVKISGTNPLPGFDVHTPEASVLTTPEHKSDWSLETLPIFDLYDSSLVTLGENYSFDLEGFSTLPHWLKNYGNVLFNDQSKLGHTLSEHSYINPGSLEKNLAETFRGGVYREVILTHDTLLYRAADSNKPLGKFFSKEKPLSSIQSRIDKAIKPEWGKGSKSIINSRVEVIIPSGTKVYIGEIANQGDFYLGGTEQIVIPEIWDIDNIRIQKIEEMK